MTLNQLAVKTGLPVPTIDNYLHSRSFPELENLAVIAEALDVKARELVVQQ